MCIRDRPYVAKLDESRALVINAVRKLSTHIGRNAEVGVSISESCPEPVSYTHLRAHETVLDIVCRLLLEKKKQKNYKEIKEKYIRHIKKVRQITNDPRKHMLYTQVLSSRSEQQTT